MEIENMFPLQECVYLHILIIVVTFKKKLRHTVFIKDPLSNQLQTVQFYQNKINVHYYKTELKSLVDCDVQTNQKEKSKGSSFKKLVSNNYYFTRLRSLKSETAFIKIYYNSKLIYKRAINYRAKWLKLSHSYCFQFYFNITSLLHYFQNSLHSIRFYQKIFNSKSSNIFFVKT